ncbi:MAG: hypothetical protein D6830_04545 [Ignavibacteria bacterium]|nr:MAG: hypothetical protein D6830_04545 [Ignavibacteria bacterium]
MEKGEKMKQINKSIIFLLVILFTACANNISEKELLKNIMVAHGADKMKSAKIDFDFRGKHYSVTRKNNRFEFTKTYGDSSGNLIFEKLNNAGYHYLKNNIEINLTEEEKRLRANSLNSVIYFFSVPYVLNDKAVKSKIIGHENVKGIDYFKLEITFNQKGGGEDFQDRYVYWINKNNYFIDYYAYYYHVNGGGSRFRVKTNRRNIKGVIFSDDLNYKSEKIHENIEDFAMEYERDKLEKVSEIKYENIEVNLIP